MSATQRSGSVRARGAWFVCSLLLLLLPSAVSAEQWAPFKRDHCTSTSTRQYSAQLMYIQGSWEDACARMPATVAGVYFTQPTRCRNNFGMWGEFDVPDASCHADWGDPSDYGCRGPNRLYGAQLKNIHGSWAAACVATPNTIDGVSFSTPTRCVPQVTGMWGEFELPDARCAGLTFQGIVAYQDGASERAMAAAEVEVWACGSELVGMCSWGKVASGVTDNAGAFSLGVPGPRAVTDRYTVRIVAANDAAFVYQQDTASVFFADLDVPRVPRRADYVLDFSRTFSREGHDGFITKHLDAAQKLRAARAWALTFRDPTESDSLGRVVVAPKVATGTAFTNSGMIHIHPDGMSESTLVHEYAHFVQENIGAYYPIPSFHDDCDMFLLGVQINSPGLAFFEGFAAFFSNAVRLMSGAEYRVRGFLPGPLSSYQPMSCDVLGDMVNNVVIQSDSIEGHVEDALTYLLFDGDGSVCGSALGRQRVVCEQRLMRTRAGLIMGIVDRELDYSMPGEKGLLDLRNAWTARGIPRAYLDRVYAALGL